MHFDTCVQLDAVSVQIVPMPDDLSRRVRVIARVRHYPRTNFEAQRRRDTGHDTVGQLLPALLHATPYKYDAVLTGRLAPVLGEILISQHVDALEDKHEVLPLDVEHALDPQKVAHSPHGQ